MDACVLWVPAGKEVEETLRIVDAQTQEAAAKKQVVEGEEAIASEKAAAAKAIKVWLLFQTPHELISTGGTHAGHT